MTLLSGQLAYYKFDTDNATQPDSEASYDATVTGATYDASGLINGCYSYDRANDYMTISDDAKFQLNSQGGISVWFRLDSTTGNNMILDKRDANDDGWMVLVVGSNLHFGMNAADTITTNTLSTGTWYHLIVNIDRAGTGKAHLYLDGAEMSYSAQPDISSNTVSVSTSTRIGINAYDLNNDFGGEIDELGFWERILTSQEISDLYNGGSGWQHPYVIAPVAAFSGSPLAGEAPLEVSFTDESTNSPTSWLWTFGGGYSSSEQHPTVTYPNPGVFTVKLTVSNAAGEDTETKVDYITVTAPSGTVCLGTGPKGTRYVATRYPVEEGLTACTTKLHGRKPDLEVLKQSTVPRRSWTGL